MTRSEFISVKRRYQKKARWVASSICLIFACTLVLTSKAAKHAGGTLTTLQAVLLFVVLIGCAVTELISIYVLFKRPEFVCPHCRKSIWQLSAILIATGRCGLCGEKILDEEPKRVSASD